MGLVASVLDEVDVTGGAVGTNVAVAETFLLETFLFETFLFETFLSETFSLDLFYAEIRNIFAFY